MSNKEMKALAIIPVRGGSKGLPGKNLMPIKGRPLVLNTYDYARKATLIDRIVVSTDDEAIAKAVLDDGGDVIMRPAEFAQDSSRVEEALVYTVKQAEEQDNCRYDIIVYMEATIPVRNETIADIVIQKLIDNPEAESVITMIKAPIHPNWMVKPSGNGEYVTLYADNECSRRQLLPNDCFYPDASVYALRRDVVFECLKNPRVYNYMGDKILAVEQDRVHSFDVDYRLDYEVAKYVAENLYGKI